MVSSSDEMENVKEEGNWRPFSKRSIKNKVGRPSGTPHKVYTDLELKTAFDFLLMKCPKTVSGMTFLEGLQQRLKDVASTQRTTTALQSLVKGKLREVVPEQYARKFRPNGKLPTRTEWFFLREYMRQCSWTPPRTQFAEDVKPEEPPAAQTGSHDVPQTESDEEVEKGKDGGRKKMNAQSTGSGEKTCGLLVTKRKMSPGSFLKITSLESAFMPKGSSTPKGPQRLGAACSSTMRAATAEELSLEEIETRVEGMVAGHFSAFKEMVMRETKAICADYKRRMCAEEEEEHKKRKKNPFFEGTGRAPKEEPIEVVQIDSSHEEGSEATGAENVDLEIGSPGKEGGHEEEQEMERTSDDAVTTEEAKAADEKKEEEKPSEEGKDNTKADPTHNFTALFEDSADKQLIHLVTSSEAQERAESFSLSPLRAKLSTVTLVEVYNVTEKEETRDDFRVIENADGGLTVCHPSAMDIGDWSNSVTIDHRNSTLGEEIGSVRQEDIIAVCKEGPHMSPMTVGMISEQKCSFKTAKIMSKGRVVKALFRRRKSKANSE